MEKRILLDLCVFLALSSAALAQRSTAPSIYSIQGTLVFETAKAPEDRIEVRLERNLQTIATVRTNLAAEFQFNSLPAGSYILTITLSGYEDVSRIVEVTGMTEFTAISIEMNPMFRIVRAKGSGLDADDADSAGTFDVKQLSNQYPKNAVQAYEQGVKENGKGEFAKAVQHFEEATALAPDFYQAQKSLGAVYLKLSRFQDAEASDRRASVLNPKAAQPFINLGMCYIQESESRAKEGREIVGKLLDNGMDALDQAIELKPQFALSHYYLGTAYYKSGFYPEAEASLLHARELDPKLGAARVVLVNVYVKERRLKDALEQIDAFIKEHPKADERKALEGLRVKLAIGLEAPRP